MAYMTRRRMGSGLALTMLGAAARAQDGALLFHDIPGLAPSPHLQRLATAGHGRIGHGAASYRRCAPGPRTAYRTYSADGACWELADLQIAPEQAGAAADGRADDREAMMAAQALSRPIALTPGRSYRVGATMALGVPVSGAGRIVAGRGFQGNVLIHGQHGFHLREAVLDGAGLPRPVLPWTGAGPPTGCAMFLEGRRDAPLDHPRLDDVVIRNTPGGGMLVKYAQGVEITRLRAENVQQQRTMITNAVVELYRCDDSSLTDCAIQDYGWKGYSIGACKRTVATRCTAQGGSAGHAAHYMDDCEDGGFVDCSHSGAGYAAKASNARGVYFRGYRATGSAGGVQIQSCKDVEVSDVSVSDTGGAALIVSSSTAGPMQGCLIQRTQAAWSAADNPNQVGLMMTANGAKDSAVTGIVVRDLSIQGGFCGVNAHPSPGCEVGVDMQGLRIDGSTQYGLIVYGHDIAVRDAQITAPGAFPAIAVYGNAGVPGGTVALSDLMLSGGPGREALIEVGDDTGRPAAFAALAMSRATARGGRSLLKARLTAGADARAPSVDVENNLVLGLTSPDGIDIGLADGIAARVQARGNRLIAAGGGLGVLRVGPKAAVAQSRIGRNQADVRIS